MIRRSSSLRLSRTPRLFQLFFIATLTLALIAPMNFVLMTPGTPTSLFPKVLTVKGVKSYPANGNIFLLTIYISNPESKILGGFVLDCWAREECVALPRSLYYDEKSDNENEYKAAKKDMSKSQDSAYVAARALMERRFPEVDISGFTEESLKVSLKNTGGPSGGLVFGLGIVELLTPVDLLQGRKVAGTGTISNDGTIGVIGGVSEKVIGAKSAGADLLFISTENCYEMPERVEGLTVVAVTSLDEVITYLLENPVQKEAASGGVSSPRSAEILGCASVGA